MCVSVCVCGCVYVWLYVAVCVLWLYVCMCMCLCVSWQGHGDAAEAPSTAPPRPSIRGTPRDVVSRELHDAEVGQLLARIESLTEAGTALQAAQASELERHVASVARAGQCYHVLLRACGCGCGCGCGRGCGCVHVHKLGWYVCVKLRSCGWAWVGLAVKYALHCFLFLMVPPPGMAT